MKIDLQSVPNLPRSKGGEVVHLRELSDLNGSGRKTDVVDFTRGQTAIEEKSFISLKASLQSGIARPSGAAKLESLQEQVRQGTYFIPTDVLVDCMLSLSDE